MADEMIEYKREDFTDGTAPSISSMTTNSPKDRLLKKWRQLL